MLVYPSIQAGINIAMVIVFFKTVIRLTGKASNIITKKITRIQNLRLETYYFIQKLIKTWNACNDDLEKRQNCKTEIFFELDELYDFVDSVRNNFDQEEIIPLLSLLDQLLSLLDDFWHLDDEIWYFSFKNSFIIKEIDKLSYKFKIIIIDA